LSKYDVSSAKKVANMRVVKAMKDTMDSIRTPNFSPACAEMPAATVMNAISTTCVRVFVSLCVVDKHVC
jgi:hypothetical protein